MRISPTYIISDYPRCDYIWYDIYFNELTRIPNVRICTNVRDGINKYANICFDRKYIIESLDYKDIGSIMEFYQRNANRQNANLIELCPFEEEKIKKLLLQLL